MVEKIFWDEPYLTECDATVTKVNGNAVYVDRTIFFAFSGGQASDTGTFNDVPVKEAVKEGDSEIKYVLAENSFKVGDKVHMKVDADRRANLRKLHSAVHIVSYFAEHKLDNPPIIGSNVNPNKSRIDYEYAESISGMIPDLQAQVNAFIARNLPIKKYEDPDNPGRRIWEADYIKIPCGGTHADTTGELGKVKLKRKNIGAGKERIEVMLTD